MRQSHQPNKMRHNTRQDMPRGFTLVELMVALVLAAGLLLAGRLLLDQMSETRHAMEMKQAGIDSTMRNERTLQELFRNLEVGTTDSLRFEGNEQVMRFISWCDSASGLRGRCAVTLTIDTAVVFTQAGTAPMTLARDSMPGVFRYLNDARNGGQWFRGWGAGFTVPLAIGIIFGHDTTVLRIGSRG